jgi:hypothetical protein
MAATEMQLFRLDFPEPGVFTIGAATPNPAQLFLFMANVEHLALLQQGVAIWNDWRTTNPGSLPDLSEGRSAGGLENLGAWTG